MQYATELELSDLCQRTTDATVARIHSYCRTLLRNEIQKRKNSSKHNELPKKSLRLSLEQGLDWKQNCFCCGQLCLIAERYPERNGSHLVETLHFREKLLPLYTGNEADNERSEVFNRLINCIDLAQAEARCHDKCRIRFFSTSLSAAVSDKKGRPVNDTRMYYFEKVYEFLEQERDLYTLKELHLKMSELAESTDVYTVKWLKNKKNSMGDIRN